MKLVSNFLCGVQVASLAEATAMIDCSGLGPARSLSLPEAGAEQRMLDRSRDPHFLVPLMAKGFAYAAADAAGSGERDIAAIVEPIRAGLDEGRG